jgi:hypothetical protein
MAIIVKRYKVRYNGVVYGTGQPAGQVITGLSKEEEARLIAESNGSIEKYVPPKIEEPKEPDGEKSDSSSAPAPGPTDEGDGTDLEGEEIAAVDPGELIKPSSKNSKKRGR